MLRGYIDWNYPEPRPGLPGALDKFLGPGTTRAELALQLGFALAAAIALPLYVSHRGLDWSWFQYALATFLAFDLMGGVVTNASSSAKRWYHREGQGFAAHFGFVALHVVYVLLVSWLFRDTDWVFFGLVSALLLAVALVVLLAPLYLRRPIALGLYALAIMVVLYAFGATPGLEWFVPLLFLKLDIAHILREEPYRPHGETRTQEAEPAE